MQNIINASSLLRNSELNWQNLTKSFQRISSGSQINSAADNAAGSAISSKFVTQIKGINQALANTQDAINLIQTTEGGLSETTNCIQRIRELLIQADTDTLVDKDREKIQVEIDQLIAQMDNIAHNTEFNTRKVLASGKVIEETKQLQINLINKPRPGFSNYINYANGGAKDSNGNFYVTARNSGTIVRVEADGTPTPVFAGLFQPNEIIIDKDDTWYVSVSGGIVKIKDGAIIDTMAGNATGLALGQDGYLYFGTTGSGIYKINKNDLTSTPIEVVSPDVASTIGKIDFDNDQNLYFSDVGTGAIFKHTSQGTDIKITEDFSSPVSVQVDNIGNIYVADTGTATISKLTPKGLKTDVYSTNFRTFWIDNNTNEMFFAKFSIPTKGTVWQLDLPDPRVTDEDNLTFMTGANEGQLINYKGINVTTEALNIEVLDISTPGVNISESFIKIDNALDKVAAIRAKLGAIQNRMESNVSNLQNVNVNMNASNSQIKDTDIAKEMSNLTKAQIINRAATALLAQAQDIDSKIVKTLILSGS